MGLTEPLAKPEAGLLDRYSDLLEFRRQAERDCLHKQLLEILLLAVTVVVYLGVGTVYFSNAEAWSAFDSLYFCIVTLGTVGFGGEGLAPDQPSTKIFCIFYIYVGILLILSRAGSLVDKIQAGTVTKLNAIAEYEALQSGLISGGQIKKRVSEASYGTAGAATTDSKISLLTDAVKEPLPTWRYYGVNLLLANAMLIGWILGAAVIFCRTEEWHLSYVDAVFFSFITATTLGYGDAELTTHASRGWCCAFILLSTTIFTALIAQFATMKTRRDFELRRWEVASQTRHASLLTDELMFKLSRSSKDGKHDKLTFLIEMLVHTDLVQRVEVSLLLDYFELLDGDKSGSVDMAELELERERVRKQELAEQQQQPGAV